MPISYIDPESGGSIVQHLAPGVTVAEAITALGYPEGTWREITEEEADELSRPTLEQARTVKLQEVMLAYDEAFAPVEAVYPAKERETWSIQLEEAKAVLADPSAETPMLSVLIAERCRGETIAGFANLVLANNSAYRLLAGSLTGQQQKMYADINALDSVADIEAYEVRYALPQGFSFT